MSIYIRTAQPTDLPAILAIYNYAVLNTTASYDYEPQTLEQRTRWFEHHQIEGLPIFVAVDEENKVTGWGSLSKFRDRIGYQHTVEHSVYVDVEHWRQGIGRALLATLIKSAQECNKHVLIGGIDASNEASVRLHESLGFEPVAHFRQVGYKFDRWLDLIFVQRMLTKH